MAVTATATLPFPTKSMVASPRKQQQRTPFVPDRTWHTSTRLAFPPPPVNEIGRTQSYAPHLQYQPNSTPLGLSSNRAEYPAYAVSKRESFRPPQVPSAFGVKSATTVTTARMSYEHPPLSPTKSYAPHLQYQPNNAPLGLSTNRAEYPAYPVSKRESFRPQVVPTAFPHFQ